MEKPGGQGTVTKGWAWWMGSVVSPEGTACDGVVSEKDGHAAAGVNRALSPQWHTQKS